MHEQTRDSQPAAAEVAPAVRLLDRYLYTAVESGASDLHFEPRSRHCRHLVVRMRVDGELSELEPPPPALTEAMLLRARLLARVDLAEESGDYAGAFRELSLQTSTLAQERLDLLTKLAEPMAAVVVAAVAASCLTAMYGPVLGAADLIRGGM